MNNRSFLRNYILVVIIFAFIVMAINYIFDPLSFYRFPAFYQAQYSNNARFQLPGFIKNEDYHTLIVGTSLSRNFIESHVDQIMHVKSLNAAIPASTAREQYLAVNLAIKTKKIDTVIWEINFYSLARSPYDVEDEQNKFPYHLWDTNPFNDIKYLFSIYPLKTMAHIVQENRKGSTNNRSREMLYKFGFDEKPLTITDVSELIHIQNAATQSNYQAKIMMKNFKVNMVEVVRNNPQIEFIFFYPPYSVFWHVRADKQNKGYLDEITKTKVEISQALQPYENVKIYDFQNRKEITHDMKHYFDVAHYFPDVNDWMIKRFVKESPIRTLREAKQKANSLREQVLDYMEDHPNIIHGD